MSDISPCSDCERSYGEYGNTASTRCPGCASAFVREWLGSPEGAAAAGVANNTRASQSRRRYLSAVAAGTPRPNRETRKNERAAAFQRSRIV